jgi:c-di-GMP-binding flagellar brake protein YcgR
VSKAATGLTVRQYEREQLEMPVEFIVSDEHAQQIKFSSSSSAAGPHTVKGTVRDISPGGMGFYCKQFLPRMSHGMVRVYGPQSDVIFQHRVMVRRVRVLDREPSYALGLAFIEPPPGIEQTIETLLNQHRQRQQDQHTREVGHARS